jgi:two-component system phosphate regulon sensor histidine kinase PhoR
VTEKRQLESAKRDFFANASHELKSPLTAIIGYQELLENGTISEEKDKEEALEATLKEARRMKEVIFQMLILSKLESETQKDKRPLPLKPLIEESLKEYDALIAKKKLKLITHLSDVQVPMASEDAHNLLANLIENGIKYNKDGGTLEITLDPAYFAIRDTGIGIATENQSRIYERFYRVDPAKSKELGGTGLGLSIVKHICLDYGFSIKLSSTLGLGTTFRVDFYPGKIK